MSTKTLSGKVAFITGGARGIGKATVEKLAEAGANIAINYYNSSDESENLAEQLRKQGTDVITVQGSVADELSVKEMIAAIRDRFGRLDILVSNAASGVLKPAMQMTLKHWRWCQETNAFALVQLLQAAKDMMQPGSRVIALTSQGSHRVIPDYSFIGASKAALESLVRALSVELAPEGITLNAVCAGAVDTDALKSFPEREKLLRQSEERSLAGRNVSPTDVANVIYLLCLPESEMIKGQTIIVDAGYSITG